MFHVFYSVIFLYVFISLFLYSHACPLCLLVSMLLHQNQHTSQIGLIMYLLYRLLGVSAIFGPIICIVIMIPLQFLVGEKMSDNAKRTAVSFCVIYFHSYYLYIVCLVCISMNLVALLCHFTIFFVGTKH